MNNLKKFEQLANLAMVEQAPALDVSARVFATLERCKPRVQATNMPLVIMTSLSVAAALLVLVVGLSSTTTVAADPWNDFVEPMTMVMR